MSKTCDLQSRGWGPWSAGLLVTNAINISSASSVQNCFFIYKISRLEHRK